MIILRTENEGLGYEKYQGDPFGWDNLQCELKTGRWLSDQMLMVNFRTLTETQRIKQSKVYNLEKQSTSALASPKLDHICAWPTMSMKLYMVTCMGFTKDFIAWDASPWPASADTACLVRSGYVCMLKALRLSLFTKSLMFLDHSSSFWAFSHRFSHLNIQGSVKGPGSRRMG